MSLLTFRWLHALVMISSATANRLYGAATKLAFWLGTQPMMV